MEMCLGIAVISLAVVVIGLLAFIWLRLPPTDTALVAQHAQALQMAFEQGCMWNRSIATDKATFSQSVAEVRGAHTTSAPVEAFSVEGEESIEMPIT